MMDKKEPNRKYIDKSVVDEKRENRLKDRKIIDCEVVQSKLDKKKKRVSKRNKAVIFAIVLCFVIICSLLISCTNTTVVPTWTDIYNFVGLSDIAKTQADFSVHFIDVGQGDSTLIKTNNCNILIDSGPESLDRTSLEYIKRAGVEKLDLIIATHPDKDHIGDMWKIVSDVDVDSVWMPDISSKLTPETIVYDDLTRVINERKIEIKYVKTGDEFIKDGLKLKVISPSKEYESTNDSSVCVKLIYKDVSFLFMGDAGEIVEEDMLKTQIDVSADVIKVGHHGSSSSTTKGFIEKIKPKYAVISVGENNYNLPKKSVIKSLENIGANVLRTDLFGDIVFTVDGSEMKITTASKGE